MSLYRRGPLYLRAMGDAGVDRDGRVIRNVSIIRRGPARGHGFWIDSDFLAELIASAEKEKKGVKARFTHPSLSADGLGTYLGRFTNFRLEPGERVIADLHIANSADASPKGSLGQYVLELAQEDPDAFGVSIVFVEDRKATESFTKEHGGEGEFRSPDERNRSHLPHVRLLALKAADLVDMPAANDGLFGEGSELPLRAEGLLCYALRLRDSMPETVMLSGIDPDRMRGFCDRFLEVHGDALRARLSADCASDCKSGEAVVGDGEGGGEIEPERREPVGGSSPAHLAAIAYEQAHPTGTPLAPRDESWDGPTEVARAAVSDLKVISAWVEDGREEVKSAYKLPHHKAAAPHAVVLRAIRAAAARLPVTMIPASDVAGVKDHLARHYAEFDLIAPWERKQSAWSAYETFCAQALAAGEVSQESLGAALAALGFVDEAASLGGRGEKGEMVEIDSQDELAEIIYEAALRRVRHISGRLA